MKRLVIHAGMEKTGTTFLQRNFSEMRSAMAARGLFYPDPALGEAGAKREICHHWLALALQDRRLRFISPRPFGEIGDYAARLCAAIEGAEQDTALISSEMFAALGADQIARLRDLLPGLEVQVVLYLRRQDAWIEAWHAQVVKVGRSIGFATTLAEEGHRLDYAALLARWAGVFGEDNLIIGVYEEAREAGGLWPDLFGRIGVPAIAGLAPPVGEANRTLAHELTMFARLQGRYGNRNDNGIRNLLEALNSHYPPPGGLRYMSREAAEDLLAVHALGNAGIARRYLGRERLFPDEEIGIAPRAEALTTEDLATVLGGMVIELLRRDRRSEEAIRRLRARLDRMERAAGDRAPS